MPSWITIYLQDEVQKLDVADLTRGISPADWYMLGEDFDIDDDDVSEFMDALVWQEEPLQFGVPDKRPVQFHFWTAPDRIAEEIGELASPPARVAAHLPLVKSIVALELGISQERTMFEAVAFEVAYWLAEHHKGLILGYNGDWYDHDDHRWDPIK
jgi:hypothetical protein